MIFLKKVLIAWYFSAITLFAVVLAELLYFPASPNPLVSGTELARNLIYGTFVMCVVYSLFVAIIITLFFHLEYPPRQTKEAA